MECKIPMLYDNHSLYTASLSPFWFDGKFLL